MKNVDAIISNGQFECWAQQKWLLPKNVVLPKEDWGQDILVVYWDTPQGKEDQYGETTYDGKIISLYVKMAGSIGYAAEDTLIFEIGNSQMNRIHTRAARNDPDEPVATDYEKWGRKIR